MKSGGRGLPASDAPRRAGALFPYVIAAIALHALVLSSPRPAHRPAPRPTAGLPLYLDLRPAPPVRSAPAPAAVPAGASGRGPRGASGLTPATEPHATADVSGVGEALERGPPVGAAERLMASARQQIRDEARRRADPMSTPSPLQAPAPESPLARSLQAPPVGEQRFADGLLKVTTRFGTVYCLQTPPEWQRSDFGGGVAVPMTCP